MKNIYYCLMSKSLNLFSGRCLSINQYDSVLYLKQPKLFLDTVVDSGIDNVVVEITDISNSSIYNAKNEKKNKSSFNIPDALDNKKNKLRQNKKLKSKMHLDKHFVDVSDDLAGLNNLKSVHLLKNTKSLKVKKTTKNKINIINDISEQSVIQENTVKNSNLKKMYLDNSLTIKELSEKLNVHSANIIKWLFLQGISATINQVLDLPMCTLIAKQYGFSILKRSKQITLDAQLKQKKQKGQLRAPVITLLGHVDHGKTTLLQAIRAGNKLKRESGNITQAIGAYEIYLDNNYYLNKLIFIDTPGHEAFVRMRTTGASITDIAVLVVSADDGFRPQTIEAINHIQSRELPFIIAISKIDKPIANISKVKRQLAEYGIYDENDPSKQYIIPISALTGENIPFLLSSLVELSKSQQLKSDPSQPAEGTIIEAYLDKKKGAVAHLLVQNGILKIGDIIVAGNMCGKVKALSNSLNHQVSFIKSLSLANVLCFSSVPHAGIAFKVIKNEKYARFLASTYINDNNLPSLLNTRISLDDLDKKQGKNSLKRINLIIKTNTQGSIDAIIYSLSNIPQDKVQINLLSVAPGTVSLKDIQLASTSDSIILAFNLNVSTNIIGSAQRLGIAIHEFEVIYDLLDCIKNHMLSFVEVDYEKQELGKAVVKNIFSIHKGIVAGCLILNGKLRKNAYFNVKRKNALIYNGQIDSLKRVKEDVEEVLANNECGVMCKDYHLWQVNDNIESYELKPLEKVL